MAFQVKNPTLKSIIDFLKNQLGSMSLINDAPTDSKKYGRKNGFWVEITEGGGGGGGSSNIGDNVYTEGNKLIIESSSTQIEDFFKNIAPEFDNTVYFPKDSLVMYNNQLYRLTAEHNPPTLWDNTSYTTAIFSEAMESQVERREILIVTENNVDVLPKTITNSNIENDMIPISMDLSVPSAQSGDWTVSTTTGSLNINGTISTTTNIILYLMKTRS